MCVFVTGASGHIGSAVIPELLQAGHQVTGPARVYRLALESAPAASRLHAVADEGVPFRDIAAAIGRGAGVPTASIAADDANDHFSFLGAFVSLDNPNFQRPDPQGARLGAGPSGPHRGP